MFYTLAKSFILFYFYVQHIAEKEKRLTELQKQQTELQKQQTELQKQQTELLQKQLAEIRMNGMMM